MAVPVIPNLTGAVDPSSISSGRPVSGGHIGSMIDRANTHLGFQFLTTAHVNLEKDLTVWPGWPVVVAADVLTTTMDPEFHSVWWRVSPVADRMWVGFSHAAIDAELVHDGTGGAIPGLTDPSVVLKLHKSDGTLVQTVTIPTLRLNSLRPYTRGITNFAEWDEQLGLTGLDGYAHTGWATDLLDVSLYRGEAMYVDIECYGVRLYSVDMVEAFFGTME